MTASVCSNEPVGKLSTIVPRCSCAVADVFTIFCPRSFTPFYLLTSLIDDNKKKKWVLWGDLMRGDLSSGVGRSGRDAFVRRRVVASALLYGSLFAALFVCASICNAHANTSALVKSAEHAGAPKSQLVSLLAVKKRPAIPGFLSGFPEPSVPTIVNRRVYIQALDDVTGGIPVLRLDRRPAKSILAAKPPLLASPPATVGPRGESGDDQPTMMVGVASTYDPINRDESEDSGSLETASGELYDEGGWTAAIRTDLRDRFGGVRYGRDYQGAYALVEASNRRIIVKINDVGPLAPGRIIDLNQRAMHYFDPTLELGLIENVRVTPLPGPYWTAGPIGAGNETMRLAADR